MQLKYLFSIAVFLFGFLLSTAAFSSPASSAKLTWTSLSETDMQIDVILPSGVEVRGEPPMGVGVAYCPHRDALPTQDALIKETAINKAESRLTFCPFKELYLC